MGGGSEGEEETQRIQPHRNTFYGCNSAIPRKQRSAMNKRSRESLSPPLPDAKKLHPSNGIEIESPQIKGPKKPKKNWKQGGFKTRFLRQAVSYPITKDEEEVVETLKAFAKMLPNDKLDKSNEDERASEPKSSSLQETRKNCMLASNVTKDESMKPQCAPTIAEANDLSSCVEGLPREIVKEYSLTKSNILEQPTIFASQKIDLPLVNSFPQANPEREALLPKSEHLADPCKQIPGMEIKQSTQLESYHSQKQQNLSWLVTSVMMEQEPLQPIKDNKGNCTSIACEEEGAPAFWPGLSMTESSGGRVQCPSAWPSTYKAPACLDSTVYTTRSSSTGNIVTTKERNSQFQSVIIDRRKPWKRSAAHVYISHLIQAGHNADKRARWGTPTVQLKATEGTNLGVKSTNGVTDLGNSQDGAICSGITKDIKENLIAGSVGSSSKKNQNEIPSGIIQVQGLQQEQHQASKTSWNHTSLIQSGDFLSLSAGHGSIDSTTAYDGGNHGRNALESSAQNVAPNICSISQCHSLLMPLSLPHAWYLSPPYPDILKMADRQQLQQLQNMDGLFYSTSQLAHAGLAKQQDHQMMWAAKLASQSGSGRTMTDFLNSQNGIDDFTLVPCPQPIPPYSAPVNKLGTKLCSRPPPQQHLLLVSSSSSSSQGKRQQQCLPSGYDLGGGLYTQGTSHLLCNSSSFN